ncbi:hypothetical protein [Pseudobacillus badius]|uniref:hypothetical protein n=1 Tax=Bacillus badius TaxID=1455 RepID=UPI0007B3BB0A|nr:hypothetical protein [Bacillus badius]KZR57527.1 hypothetical protein A3781_19740 [Bacillus badius]
MEKKYKVEDSYDNWETIDSTSFLTAEELRRLAEYYYSNSDETEVIDFSVINNCIEFVRRVDKVDGITYNKQ